MIDMNTNPTVLQLIIQATINITIMATVTILYYKWRKPEC